MRADSSPSVINLPSGFLGSWDTTASASAYAGATAKLLSTIAGTVQDAVTPTWPNNIGAGNYNTMGHIQGLSPALATQFIDAGSWNFGFAAAIPSGATWEPFVSVNVVNGQTGTIRSTIIPVTALTVGTRTTTTEYTCFGSIGGSAVNVLSGDYLSVEFGLRCYGPGIPNTSIYQNGTTTITTDAVTTSDAKSFVVVPQALIPFISLPITVPLTPTLQVSTSNPAPTANANLYDLSFSTDLVIGPSGDLALVTGKNAFLQHLSMLLMSPVGSLYYDPEWGDGLMGLIGQPGITNAQLESHINSLIILIDALGVSDGVGVPKVVPNTVSIASLSGVIDVSLDISFPDNSTQSFNLTYLQGEG